MKKLKTICMIIVVVAIMAIPLSSLFADPISATSSATDDACAAYLNCDWTLSCFGDAIRCEMQMTDPYRY